MVDLDILRFIKSKQESGEFNIMSEEMKSAFHNKGLKTNNEFDQNSEENKRRWVNNQIKKIKADLALIDDDIDEYEKKISNQDMRQVRSYAHHLSDYNHRNLVDEESIEKYKTELLKNFTEFLDEKMKIEDRSHKDIIDKEIMEQLQKKVEIKVYSPDPKIKFLESLNDHQFDLTKDELIDLLAYSINKNNIDLFKFCLNYKSQESKISVLEDIIKSDDGGEDIKKFKEDLSKKICLISSLESNKDKKLFYDELTNVKLDLVDNEEYKTLLEKKFTFFIDAFSDKPENQKHFLKYLNIADDLSEAISSGKPLDKDRYDQVLKGGNVLKTPKGIIESAIIQRLERSDKEITQ